MVNFFGNLKLTVKQYYQKKSLSIRQKLENLNATF